ncbi:MAG TPA: threonine ammonia-lyase [Acidimicrobiia bacterium]|nr:threonine ammonia-lyase [Acidimicrobiia bacterium]
MITIEQVKEARSRFGDHVSRTPLLRSNSFSGLSGREVYLKAECMQRAGSFKIRGALNVVSRLEGAPVVAASAGNHAQGVALAARISGSPCTVFMPTNAAIPKIKATQDYGARVKLKGRNLADAVESARQFAEKTGARFVHPYDDELIIAGQATLGEEIVEDLPEVGTVIVPTGGGGLLAGTALAVKTLRPEATVIGVEASAAGVYAASMKAGHLITDYPRTNPTIADGIAVTVPSEPVWDLVQKNVDSVITVDDSQTMAALTLILERSKLMVEAAGAVGVAALLEGLIPEDAPDPVCIVLSGGNIDLMVLGKVVRHGLQASGRFAQFTVHVPDQPGSLAGVLTSIAKLGGNVVQVDHHREGLAMPFGKVEIEISVETRDRDHAAAIAKALSSVLVRDAGDQ